MSTIGYGDISPVSVLEKIYGIVISFLACGVFAFAVNMIGYKLYSIFYIIKYVLKIGTIFQERA